MLYQIGDFLKRIRVPVVIEDDKVYRLVTIRMNHKGVVQREKKSGSAIGTKTMYRVTAGQFILSGIDARNGAFGIVPDELDGAVVTNDFWYFEIDNTIISKNYFLYLTSTPLFADIVRKASDGTTNRVRLQADKFYTHQVDLPDVSNQDEVIEKVLQHEAAIRTVQAELQTQQNLLAKLRQSILQEAVQGKLTERWREERNALKQAGVGQVAGSNPVGGSANEYQTPTESPVTSGGTGSSPVRTANQSDEIGAELLARIRAEKAELIRQGKLRKEKPLPPITDAEKPFDLPDGWVWCRLGSLCRFGPTNGYSPKPSTKVTEVKCLTLTATTSGSFRKDKFKYIDELIPIDSSLWLKNGDLLIQRGNSLEYVGISAIYTEQDNEFIYPDLMMKIKLFEGIDVQFIHFYLLSPDCRQYYIENASGAQKTMPKINQAIVAETIIPMPPLVEQQAVVAQVENALAQVSELEAENRQQQTEVGRLMQAVLREAFAGKEVVEN